MTGDPAHDQKRLFQKFFQSEVSGSIVLLACTIVALAWANSPWAADYFRLAHTKIGLSWGDASFKLSLQHWVNDALMVIFFFVVGLEVKREIVVGQLSSMKKAILPISAAVGGMVVPAGLYLVLNAGGDGARGWGVPMATDIAFALGVLALFGSRAPLGLKVFLTALAIADDIGAVLVIALFYTERIWWGILAFAGIFLFLIFLAGRLGIRRPGIYLLLAIGVWAAVLGSGIHATIAGVLVAMMVPVRAEIDPTRFLARARRRLDELAGSGLTQESMVSNRGQLRALDDLHHGTKDMIPAGIALEHSLHPIQSFFILPLFALFNAGVAIDGSVLKTLVSPVGLGIVVGLFLGKQIGVTLFSWIAVRTGYADLPGITWPQIYGAGCLAGIGFTMSLFVAELAFKDAELLGQAKLGILAASLISGIVGYLILQRSLPKTQ